MDALAAAVKVTEVFKVLQGAEIPSDTAANFAFSLVMEEDRDKGGFDDLFKQEKHLDGHGG